LPLRVASYFGSFRANRGALAASALVAFVSLGCGRAPSALGAAASTPSPPPAEVGIDEPEPGVVEEPGEPPAPHPSLPHRADPDGLVLEDLATGTGRAAQTGDRVVVHYDGTLPDGTRFDSSRQRGQPFEVELGRGMLIEGFERAVQGMRPGGVRRAIIPPALGYGTRAIGGKIPPNATLVFEIELIAIR
jgi:hypothetical protein